MSEYMTVTDAANYLGVSRSQMSYYAVNRMVRGYMTTTERRKCWMVEMESLYELKRKQEEQNGKPVEGKQYISTHEAASILEVKQTSVSGMICKGKLRGYKTRNEYNGFVWMVEMDSLTEFLESRKPRRTQDERDTQDGIRQHRAVMLSKEYMTTQSGVTLSRIASWLRSHNLRDVSAYAYDRLPGVVYDALVSAGYIDPYPLAVRGAFTAMMDRRVIGSTWDTIGGAI